MKASDTLCWTCANAYGQCSWSESFVPVEGWDATKTKLSCGLRIVAGEKRKDYIDSYIVNECPKYVKEEFGK